MDPDEFLLLPADLPTWSALPAQTDLKTHFGIDWCTSEYYEQRSLVSFEPREQDLISVHYAESEPEKRQAFLASVDRRFIPERLPPAKVLNIGTRIQEKQAEDPDHPPYLTTRELLELFDELNVRPATLAELLAYAGKYARPKEGQQDSMTTEERAKHSASSVYALGSVFPDSLHTPSVPHLRWEEEGEEGNETSLITASFGEHWYPKERFLVFRKSKI